MLCGRMFGLTTPDTDGTILTLDRHRLFECSGFPILIPEHVPHGWKTNRRDRIQVAGSYGGARRDKREAREVRKGGYVPASLEVQRALLGTPWMSEKGCQLSIPPAYTQHIGEQLIAHIAA
jgi:DNA (cytosine-5)-methyltransferase 1